jgi:predicted glycosyltransferase
MKIIQYSQHVLGIGHFMRSLEISRALSDHEVILVTGGVPVDTHLPKHICEFRLSDLQMNEEFKGLFSTEQDTTVDQIKKKRQQRLFALIEREKPDVFVIELYPFGRKALRRCLQRAGHSCRKGKSAQTRKTRGQNPQSLF